MSPTDSVALDAQAQLDQHICEQTVPAALPGAAAAVQRDADQEQQRRPLGALLPAASPSSARAPARATDALHPRLPQGAILTILPQPWLYLLRSTHCTPLFTPRPPPGRDLVVVGVHARGLRPGDGLPETAAQAAAARSDVLRSDVSPRAVLAAAEPVTAAACGSRHPQACMHARGPRHGCRAVAGQLQGSAAAAWVPQCRAGAAPRRRPRRRL